MLERQIKELSFALEALSRINGYDASVQKDRVSGLLDKLIEEAKEANTKRDELKTTTADNHDDIPF